MRHSSLAVAAFLWSSGVVICSAASSSLAATPSSSLRESLRRRYPRDDITVVFSDSKYVPFALNNRESFRRNDPTAQYLAVGMDEETVRLLRAHEAASMDGGAGDGEAVAAVESALFSDILSQGQRQRNSHDPDATLSDLGKLRCARLDVVSYLQDMGYNILLLDSDVSVTSRFDSSYFASLGADFVSGHGTFPRFAYDALGFALQSGMYYVRSSPGGRALIADAAARCRQTEDGQVALNAALMDAYSVRVPADGDGVMEKDECNTVVYDAVAKTTSRIRSNGSVAAAMRIGILGKEYFPSGCKFADGASEDAWIRHPGCFSRNDMSDEERINVKEQSLRSMGGWYLPESPQPGKDTETRDAESATAKTRKKKWTKRHKAVLWSFPGSGNTMLRYTFESITGQPGSTNAIYTDKRLVPVLPGEGTDDGKLVKIHPAQDILNPVVIQRKADAYAQSDARIILMRDPYDAIWSWYQLVQTGSHSGRIRERDFNVDHFRRAALRWAHFFRRAVEEEYVPYMEGNPPEKSFLIKFEDLVKNQDGILRDMLSFLDEEVAVDGPLTVRDHPIVKRDPATDDTVPKSSAYDSQELIDAMWSIMGPSAERFGYVKPSAPPSSSSSSSSSFSSSVALSTALPPEKGRSSSRGYLTYTPSGGLTNQLMELEVAVRYALESRRTLLLPPVLSTPVKIFPNIWTDDKAERRCTAETRSAEAPDLSYDELNTIPWDEIIDVARLSKRVPLVTSLPPDEYDELSRLSFLEYHKCNTRWTDRKLSKGENCLPDHVPSGATTTTRDGPVKVRSLDCAFQFTRGVDLLNMGAIFGTYSSASPGGGAYVFPKVRFAPNVHDAALRAVRHIREEASPEGSYLCAHLRLAGSEWEDYSPFQSGTDDAVAAARSFLAEKDPSGTMPLYIATDNEDAVRTKTDLCDGGRLCLFASDFADLTSSMGLGHFQQIVPFEYLTCASADDVIATSEGMSSFGWLIKRLHDGRARQQHKVHLTSSTQLALPSSVVSATAAATVAEKSHTAKEQQAVDEAAMAAMRERQTAIEKNQASENAKRHQAAVSASAKKRLTATATATAQQRRAVSSSASVHNPMHGPLSDRAFRGKTMVTHQRHYQKEQQLEVRTEANEVSESEHKKSTEEKKYAYVALLGWNPDASQRATYATATRALVRSLKDMGTRADIVVMTSHGHPRDAALEETLRSDGAIVVPVDPIVPPSPDMGGAAANFEPWFVELVLGKLSALRLTEYDRIQFLDTDVVLLKETDLDTMFERFPETDLVMEGLGPESPVRAGWFMVRPSEDAFEDMAATLRRGRFTRDRGWDELGLPVDYPGWKGDVAKHTDKWGFYGAALEQGLLYHHYYAFPKSQALSSTDADVDASFVEDGALLEILDDRKMQSLGMVHCYGKLKPWNAGLDLTGVARVYSAARERWNGVVASIGFAFAPAVSEGAAARLVYKSPTRTVTSVVRRLGKDGRRETGVRREVLGGTDRATAAKATNNKKVYMERGHAKKRPSLEHRRAPQGHFERSDSSRRFFRGRALQGGDEDKALIDHAEFQYNFADYRVAPRVFDESGLAEYSYAEGGFAEYAFAEYAMAENGFAEYSVAPREFDDGAYAEYSVSENGFAEYSVAPRGFEDGAFAEYSNVESSYAEYSIAPRTFDESLAEYDYSSGTEGVDRRARFLQVDDHKYIIEHAEFEYNFSDHAGAPRAYDESGLAEYSYADSGFADYSVVPREYDDGAYAEYAYAEYAYAESGFADYSVAPREYDDGVYAEYTYAESDYAEYSVAPREYDDGAYAEYAYAESDFAEYSIVPKKYDDGVYAEYAVADSGYGEYSGDAGDVDPRSYKKSYVADSAFAEYDE